MAAIPSMRFDRELSTEPEEWFLTSLFFTRPDTALMQRLTRLGWAGPLLAQLGVTPHLRIALSMRPVANRVRSTATAGGDPLSSPQEGIAQVVLEGGSNAS